MRQFITLFIAALAIAITLPLAPAPISFTTPAAAGQRYDQGGVVPCSADDYRFVPGRGWVSNCRSSHHRGQRGGGHTVAQPYIYLQSRTCVDWVMRNGVKVILGTRAC